MKKYTFLLAVMLCAFMAQAQHSLYFDGQNDNVIITKNESLQATNAITIEAWINAETWQSSLFKGSVVSNSNNIGADNGFDLRAGENGKAEFNLSVDGSWAFATSTEIMEADTWYHLAGVYDGTYLRLYINGIERAKTDVSGEIGTFRGNFLVGACPGWTGRFFNGKIDEVRLWNTARTTDEIRTAINTELSGTEAGLIGYWKFNEGSGLVAFDATANANNGALTNMDEATAWVENFDCPFTEPDVGPTSLITPVSANYLSNNESVTISITNYSIADIADFDISYSINNGDAVVQNFSEGMAALETKEVSFDVPADLSQEGLYNFTITTQLENDAHPENDEITAVVNHFSATDNFAIEFDGVNDYIRIADDDALDFTESLCLEAWIKATAWKDQAWQGSILSKDADEGGTQTGYVMRAGKNGTVQFVATPGWDEIGSGEMMQLNKWYHVASVYGDGAMKLYVNGALVAQKDHEGPLNTNTVDLLIGEGSGFSGRQFQGMIDEVRIWNIARTEEEINQYIATELEGTEEGLVAYFPMNDGLGNTTIEDKTGHGHIGTLTNLNTSECWVAGFEPTQNDVGVQALASPASGPVWTDTERVKAVVSNYAMTAAQDFNISYQINENEIVTEYFTGIVEGSESFTYAFKQLEDLSGMDQVSIRVFTDLESDTDRTNDTLSAELSKSNLITIFDQQQHNFSDAGQLHSRIMSLPADNSNYSNILLHINLECPEFGCDPWDQPAFLKVKKDGQTYELGRYITPFGVACGPWTVDVTDFRSILTGYLEFISYVQVWGASGWLVTLQLEYVEGTPNFAYTELVPLWNTDYQVYGDPNVSYDLPEMAVPIEDNVEQVNLRLTTTGHGQGNTDNAAEFAHKIHHISVNGTESLEQDLWKPDCNQNPCSPQSGTWQYARAGWCPGQEVIPNEYDLTQMMVPGNDLQLDYVLEEYTNLLNTGYNGGSHTEPYFRIHSYLIKQSNTMLGDVSDIAVESLVSPVTSANLTDNEAITVRLKNNGNQIVSDFEISFKINEGPVVTEMIAQSINPGESYDYTFVATADLSEEITYNIFVISSLSMDADPQNDYILAEVEHQAVGISSYAIQPELSLVPNPAKNQCSIRYNGPDAQLKLEIADMQGRCIYREDFTSNKFETTVDLTGLNKGVYFVRISGANGVKIEKLILQ